MISIQFTNSEGLEEKKREKSLCSKENIDFSSRSILVYLK